MQKYSLWFDILGWILLIKLDACVSHFIYTQFKQLQAETEVSLLASWCHSDKVCVKKKTPLKLQSTSSELSKLLPQLHLRHSQNDLQAQIQVVAPIASRSNRLQHGIVNEPNTKSAWNNV